MKKNQRKYGEMFFWHSNSFVHLNLRFVSHHANLGYLACQLVRHENSGTTQLESKFRLGTFILLATRRRSRTSAVVSV